MISRPIGYGLKHTFKEYEDVPSTWKAPEDYKVFKSNSITSERVDEVLRDGNLYRKPKYGPKVR